jgi:hypothetical protein
MAIRAKNEVLTKKLVNAGADYKVKNYLGVSAIDLAKSKKYYFKPALRIFRKYEEEK